MRRAMDDVSLPPITFAEAWTHLFPDRHFVGPLPPISDHRLAAALLFIRWNDRTGRVLEHEPRKYSHIVVTWYGERGACHQESLPVTPEVVKFLCDNGMVSGTPQWGYTDNTRLLLNAYGKKTVVGWMADAGFYDYMSADAVLDTEEGRIRWRRA